MTPRQRRPSCALDDASWVVECSEAELANWLGSLRWQPVRLCLQHCLLQVTQCFADSRFELRRMADQVLRPLAEVALWGELPVLQQLWSSFVPLVDSLPCWVSASTMLLVLQRTSAFHLLLQPSPSQPAAPTGMLTTGPPPTAPPAPPPLLPGWPVPPGWSAAVDSASGQIVFVHARARSTSAPSHKAVLITPENVHALPPPPRADGGNIIMGSPLIQRLPASPAVRPDQLPSQMKQSPQLQPLLSDFERSVYRVGGAEAFADEVASTAREWQATGRLTPAVISETGREHVAGDNTASEMTSASPLPACGASISDRPEARAPGPSDISYGVLPQNTEHDARLALC